MEVAYMLANLTRQGDRYSLLLEKSYIDALLVDDISSLEVTTNGRNLIISPVRTEKQFADVMNSLEKINLHHGKTLQKLAQ